MMNNPFDYTPDPRCEAAFSRLCANLETLKESADPTDRAFIRELEAGKMLGVLIAEDSSGCQHALYAFSGQIGAGGFHRDGFVEAPFDYLDPEGHFKTEEAEISRLNKVIDEFESGPVARLRLEYETEKERLESEVATFKEKTTKSKHERAARRQSEKLSEEDRAQMIRESQFEKAELHRMKKRMKADLEPFTQRLSDAERKVADLKAERRARSEALQEWLFSNFRLLNARGESKSLIDIFASTPMKVPPSGAGECCGPKLLQAVYQRGLTPIAMAEYWYGVPKGGEIRRHGHHYPACRGKCLPVLRWMLQGLDVDPPLRDNPPAIKVPVPEVLFENQWFCIISKPSGMLSVPGKGEAISVQQWLDERYGVEKEVRLVHRLDQDTSGLLVASFGGEVYRMLQAMFAKRQVSKRYVALLEGDYRAAGLPDIGKISLPLSPDWLDRPRQRVDFEKGKEAVTEYEFSGVEEGRSRVLLRPLTGRTHQLRVHAASEKGLGIPIAGDPLYGDSETSPIGRLCLHAHKLKFTFPIDNRQYEFESPLPF